MCLFVYSDYVHLLEDCYKLYTVFIVYNLKPSFDLTFLNPVIGTIYVIMKTLHGLIGWAQPKRNLFG